MTTHFGTQLRCPACGYRADAATAVGDRDATLKPGDASICLGCGQLLFFELDFIGLRHRLPTRAEHDQLRTDPRIIATLDAYRIAFGREPRTEVTA